MRCTVGRPMKPLGLFREASIMRGKASPGPVDVVRLSQEQRPPGEFCRLSPVPRLGVVPGLGRIFRPCPPPPVCHEVPSLRQCARPPVQIPCDPLPVPYTPWQVHLAGHLRH